MYGAYASDKSKGQGTFEPKDKDTILVTPEPGFSLPEQFEPVTLVGYPPDHWRGERIVLLRFFDSFLVGSVDKLDFALPA